MSYKGSILRMAENLRIAKLVNKKETQTLLSLTSYDILELLKKYTDEQPMSYKRKLWSDEKVEEFCLGYMLLAMAEIEDDLIEKFKELESGKDEA